MWPRSIDWKALRFGVEFEFVGADPKAVELLPGWMMALDEHQYDESGRESGSELKPPPIRWEDRAQIRQMLDRLRALGAEANWSCGLHVHVGLEPWGQEILLPLIDAALSCQAALRELFQTPEHRMVFCPPVTPEMRERYLASPERPALVHRGRPESHRCGINAAAWFDIGTVEIRLPNGSLEYETVMRTVELCLRLVAAVGAGRSLPGEAAALAEALGAPACGYPPPVPAPLWHHERLWLEDALIPSLAPIVEKLVPEGEILHIRPVPSGLLVAVEDPDDRRSDFRFRLTPGGWELQ